ncbi:type II toxin-antitoxin system death-on-curing family toxin [Weissella soli]|uniref:type II toxin-antitoxin system death-on-curing family toxin n=1 Tax=Weissella soli TaxID=155866 RepID=UPI0011BAE8F4|nr:type II toxin-antitoxin system death-on-curing family toxin [Weissella soli]QEA34497.1 type II toxin-antitoxin system death-on-curing family toxin [Weissella soli]
MTFYFDSAMAVKQHDIVLEKSGGLQGIKEIGLLESTLDFIQDDRYYPTFEEKLTHLVFAVAKNHAFLDGNKRSSIVLGAFFLNINEYPDYVIDRFMNQMESIVLVTVINQISKDDLSEIIALIINDLPYTDELAIKLTKAIQYYNDNFSDNI